MFQDISERGLNAIVFTMPYLNAVPSQITEEGKDRVNDAIDEVNVIFNNTANDWGFDVFDFHGFMINNPSYYHDSIHLTCTGYEQLANEIIFQFF